MILSPYERQKRDAFLKKMGHSTIGDIEETCDGAASYHYEIYPSNIGDNIFVVFKGEREYISDPDSF